MRTQNVLVVNMVKVAWLIGTRCDPEIKPLADRHYSRQNPNSPNFAPPGRCLVLKSVCRKAYWITSWPYARYTKHEWAGAFVCSAFRNEGYLLSSKLIEMAVAMTRHYWPDIPELGMITFVDTKKVKKKRDFGRCFLKAGFKKVGYTKGGLLTLQLLPDRFPKALPFAPNLQERCDWKSRL